MKPTTDLYVIENINVAHSGPRVGAFTIVDGVVHQATDDELRDMGYVKLDVDADRLRLALSRWDDVDANYITSVARQVLAALDGETP